MPYTSRKAPDSKLNRSTPDLASPYNAGFPQVTRPKPSKRTVEPAAAPIEMGPPTPTLCSQKQRPEVHLPASRPDSSAHPSSSTSIHPSRLTPLPAQPYGTATARAQSATAPLEPASWQAASDASRAPAVSGQAASEAREAPAVSAAGCATVVQPSRVNTDWQTPPSSATLQVLGLQVRHSSLPSSMRHAVPLSEQEGLYGCMQSMRMGKRTGVACRYKKCQTRPINLRSQDFWPECERQ
jgi:hypothetical protein